MMLKLLHRMGSWLCRRRWPVALALLPFAYVAAVTLPHPFGLALQHGNDFQAHRIWWTDLATWYLKQGFVPVWSPSLDFGTVYFGQFGHGFYYAPGWWLHPFHAPEIPALQTWSHYLQICLHMAIALLGVYRLLRTRAGVSEPAAVLGSSLLLINHRFHDFVRYPSSIETMAWIPWILMYALRLAEGRTTTPGLRGRVNDFLMLTLLVALSWTAGYGQLTYIGGLLIALTVLMCANDWKGPAIAAAAATAGTFLAVGPLAPTALMASLSPQRGGGNFSFATQNPLRMSVLEMLSHPFSADVHASAFLPPALLGLAVAGMVLGWRRPDRRLSAAMLLGAVLIFDLSRGAEGWLCRPAYEHLPMYSAFRIQDRNNWITLLALCWFAGLGAEKALSGGVRARRTVLGLVLFVPALTALLHLATTPPSHALFSAEKIGEMSPQLLSYSFWMLLGGSTLLVMTALWFRRGAMRIIALTGLVWVFVFFYGRHSTWYRPPPSTRIHPSFPAGMLASYRVGFGLTSQCLVSDRFTGLHARVMQASGGMTARFPASRFLFLPDEPHSDAGTTLVMESYGPNHVRATVHAPTPGRLIYFNTMFQGWKGSPNPEAAPAPFDRFMCFRVPAGETSLDLSFAPAWILASGMITLAGMPLLAAWIAGRKNRRAMMIAALAVGLLSNAFYLYGALTRKSMSQRALFGPDGSTRDPTGRVPALFTLAPIPPAE